MIEVLKPTNPASVPLVAQQAPSKQEDAIAAAMKRVIEQKEQNQAKSLIGRITNPSEIVMVGGDLFNAGYMSFQVAQILKPSLLASPSAQMASLVCGEIAAVLNIWVAGICIKEGIQAVKNKDTLQATKLFFFGAALAVAGVIMMVNSLSMKVAALGGTAAFFAVNPWLLPLIFFIVTAPTMLEVIKRVAANLMKKDYASQLQKIMKENVSSDDISALVHSNDENSPFALNHLQGKADLENRLSDKMELLQADMGVEAAIETFKLMQLAYTKESSYDDFLEQYEIVQQKISEWNNAQYLRLFQQVLFVGSFGLSMGALANATLASSTVLAIENLAMAAANAIPFYMDTFWPFKRNVPMVVPRAEPAVQED